jgi:glycerophosphoryl diester phosphodiesterase
MPRHTLIIILALGCNEAQPQPDRLPVTTADCWAERACADILVLSHKGDGVDEPENSIAAIKALAEAGVDAVEVDPRLTRDGHFVLMHDEGIKRTTSADDDLPVSSLTLDEIQAYALTDPRCPTPQAEPQRCQVPTLADALDAAKGRIVLLLDVKDRDAERLLEVLRQHHGVATSLVRNTDLAFLDTLSNALPDLLTLDWTEDEQTALEVIDNRGPKLMQVDPGDLAAVQAAAAAKQVRVMVATVTNVDLYLWAHVDGGALGQEAGALQAIEDLKELGVRLFLTSYPIQIQRLLAGESLAP